MKFTTRAAQLLIAISAAAAVAPASADVLAFDSTRATGNQSWTGSLGMEFDVLAPINISSLGAFDSDHDGFANAITVGIFDRDTGLLVGSSISLTDANTVYAGANNRMADIVDFVLGVGRYAIVAHGFSAQDRNGNAGVDGMAPTINSGAGLISFTGTARFGNGGFGYPASIDTGPANRYDAGTFAFSAVPEPGSLAILGLGLLGLAALRRRKN